MPYGDRVPTYGKTLSFEISSKQITTQQGSVADFAAGRHFGSSREHRNHGFQSFELRSAMPTSRRGSSIYASVG